jgi:hypothetical protein
MLSILDRRLRPWHFWLANAVALGWFAGMSFLTREALPGTQLVRCPIGLCLGFYAPDELRETLDGLEEGGRAFLADTLLPLDMILPALLLIAFCVTCVWFTRPGEPMSVPVSTSARYTFLCVPLLYCLADYGENFALGEALEAYPDISDELAHRASLLTAAKSQLIVASLGIAAALAVAAWSLARGSRGGSPPGRG